MGKNKTFGDRNRNKMTKVEAKSFSDLFNTAKLSTEESLASPTLASTASKKVHKALQDTFEDATKAAKVLAQKAKLTFKYFEKNPDTNASVEGKNVTSVVNWLVVTFQDMIDKLNDQGEPIAAMIKKAGDESYEDICKKYDELDKKCIDLENRLQAKVDDLDKETGETDLKQKQLDLENKTREIENSFNKKCSAIDKEYDEVRQRCLKGNLIVSSPVRTTSGGHNIPSLAKHEMFWDRFGNWRCETDMEMIQRLIELKTGVWVNERDVTACHPLGRREKNTFIISISNRSPLSSWDMITRGMMSGENNFSKDNIFINFQLTKRRGEIAQEVRKAKKDGLVKSYEIDMNGRIFVKYAGTNNKTYEIFNKNDIQNNQRS